jgi:cyanophycin synthetase
VHNPASNAAWRLLGQVQEYHGHVHGCRYPSIVLNLQGAPMSRSACDRLSKCLLESCPSWKRPRAASDVMDWRQSVEWLLSAWQDLQVSQGLPVFETGRILGLSQTQVRCVVPTLGPSQRAFLSVIQHSLVYLSSHDEAGQHESTKRLRASIELLRRHGAKGSNVPRFVKAGLELGIPIRELPGGSYQYGVAKRARWLDSSFTDVTPSLSARLARSKVWASDLLKQAGLPVPSHQLVDDAESALKVAHRIGYPVVVKPADLDGGLGVAAGLETDDEVREAIAVAQKHSKHILVEKHVKGRDYRLTVFNGKMIWAIERIPGGVTGDGQHTVAQLVEQLNADPRRGTDMHSPLKALIYDEEVRQLLQRQGMTAQSVPGVGQFVRFRRAANVAAGGTPVAVFEQVHPDNARLAIRAAEALRLDLAGIDLLIPDVATSWRETGAFICEVNAQPNLGQTTAAHLYGSILKQMVPGSGRVPTLLILGAAEPRVWLDELSDALAAQGFNVGSVGPQGVKVGDESLTVNAVSPYVGGKMLALNQSVDAIVLAINDDTLLKTGLPVDRYDALILAGTQLQSNRTDEGQSRQQLIGNVLTAIVPACDGVVVTHEAGGLDAQALANRTTARWHTLGGEITELVNEAAQLALACADRRESNDIDRY